MCAASDRSAVLADAPVEVEIGELARRTLAERHFLIVEDHPPTVLLHVAHVVPGLHRGAHVGDEGEELVLARPSPFRR